MDTPNIKIDLHVFLAVYLLIYRRRLCVILIDDSEGWYVDSMNYVSLFPAIFINVFIGGMSLALVLLQRMTLTLSHDHVSFSISFLLAFFFAFLMDRQQWIYDFWIFTKNRWWNMKAILESLNNKNVLFIFLDCGAYPILPLIFCCCSFNCCCVRWRIDGDKSFKSFWAWLIDSKASL